ncbi:MAG TPA: hypothetical protein VFQ16_04365 [Burkholderiaceae bacterium]|nr:hypothetical protein [Burkholderiaceae bacterium]
MSRGVVEDEFICGGCRPFSDIHLAEQATAKQSLAPGRNLRGQPWHNASSDITTGWSFTPFLRLPAHRPWREEAGD